MAARTDLEQLVYQMSADIKALERANKRALRDVDNSAGKMQRRYDQLGAEMGRSFGNASVAAGAAFGAIVAYATKAASDAQETANAFQVAFGKMTPEAEKFAKTYSSTVGRSLTETQANMAKTQLILTGVGLTAEQALGMTEAIQRRAVDLGSLWNVKDAEAYQAIISGISGEAEPLKKFGVALNEAAVKSELLSLGFKGNAADAPEAAKAVARLNIIMRATAKADGDAVKTKDGLANSTKSARAEFEKAAVALGEVFLPAATKTMQAASALLGEFNKLPDAVKLGGLAILGLVAAGGPLFAAIEGMRKLILVAGAARAAIAGVAGTSVVAGAVTTGGTAAAVLSLKGDAAQVSLQATLNERLKEEQQLRVRISELEGKSGRAADEKLDRARKNLAVVQDEIRSLRANDRAGRISANRAAMRKKAKESGGLENSPTQYELPAWLKTPTGGTKSSSGGGGKKAKIDLNTKTIEVDESTVFDLVNTLGGVRNALPPVDANPADFVSAEDRSAALIDSLDRSRSESEAFWADTIEGGLWAAFEGGGSGVAQFFARQLAAAMIRNVAGDLAKALTSKGALGKAGDFFAGFFATGGTIPAGQWGVVNDGGPEAIRAKPGGGIEVMNNRALTSLAGLNRQVPGQVVYRDRVVKVITEASPYFDQRVETVAAPGALKSAQAASDAGAARATARARTAGRYKIRGK
jgi:hypothetical protein